MATATDSITVRAREIAAREGGLLLDRTAASKRLYERALQSLPLGVGSSFQVGDPYPLYIREGKGSRIWDVDDNEYVDFHNGFGCMIVGHAHPKVAEAISRRAHRHPLRRRPRRRWSSPRCSASGSGASRCDSATPAPRPRCTRSESRRRPAATTS